MYSVKIIPVEAKKGVIITFFSLVLTPIVFFRGLGKPEAFLSKVFDCYLVSCEEKDIQVGIGLLLEGP